MSRSGARSLASLAGVLLVVGCRSPAPPSPGPRPPLHERSEASEPVLPDREGLPEDHRLILATRTLAKCRLTVPSTAYHLETSCPHYAAWDEAMPAIRHGADRLGGIDVSLIRMLHDDDVALRRSVAFTLDRAGSHYIADPDLAHALIDVAERETDVVTASLLGRLCGEIDVALPRVWPRLERLAAEHPIASFREEIIGPMTFRNKTPEVFALAVSLLKHPDSGTRLAAVRALWIGTPDGMASDACAAWRTAAADSDPEIAYSAMDLLVRRPCREHHAWAVEQMEPRLDLPEVGWGYDHLLEWLARDERVDPEVARRAQELRARPGSPAV